MPLQPRRNRCVFWCKMRPVFISTVNLQCTPADRGEIVMFSRVKCAWAWFRLKFAWNVRAHSRRPRRNRCVLSCKMRLGFTSSVNSNATPANPGEIVVFSHVKCAWSSSWLNLFATPANPGEIAVFSHVNAPGLHLDCTFIRRSRQPRRTVVFSNAKCAWTSSWLETYMSILPTPEKLLCFLT